MKSRLNSDDLRLFLSRARLVQEDFAIKIKVRQSTVSRWLKGTHPVPGYVEAWLKEAYPAIYKNWSERYLYPPWEEQTDD